MRLGLGVQENIEEDDEHHDGYTEDKCQVLLSILVIWLLFVGSTDSDLGRFNKGCCVARLYSKFCGFCGPRLLFYFIFIFFNALMYVPGAIVPLLCFSTQLETSVLKCQIKLSL